MITIDDHRHRSIGFWSCGAVVVIGRRGSGRRRQFRLHIFSYLCRKQPRGLGGRTNDTVLDNLSRRVAIVPRGGSGSGGDATWNDEHLLSRADETRDETARRR